MEVKKIDNGIILQGVQDFDPVHIFECGQCFRWIRQEDDSFTGVVASRVVNVKKVEDDIIIDNTNMEDFEKIWYNYFDLGRDYSKIKKELSEHDEIGRASCRERVSSPV